MRLNKAQQRSLRGLYERNPNGSLSYLDFRRRIFPLPFEPDVAMIVWCGITLGIEPDGYMHS